MDYWCYDAAQAYADVALQTMDGGLAPPGTWIVNAVDAPRNSANHADAMVGSLLLVGACQRSQRMNDPNFYRIPAYVEVNLQVRFAYY